MNRVVVDDDDDYNKNNNSNNNFHYNNIDAIGYDDDDFRVTFVHDRTRYKTLCAAFKRQRNCRVVPVQWVGEYYDLLAIRDPPRCDVVEANDGHRVDDREQFGKNAYNKTETILDGSSSDVSSRSPLCLLRIHDDEAIENAVRYYHDRWIWLSMLMFGINPCGNHSDPSVAGEAEQNFEDGAEIVSEPIRQDASARREREFLLRFFEQDLRVHCPVDETTSAENSVALAVCGRLRKSNEIMARRLYSDFARLATENSP